MSIVVVGSVAYDGVETPHGKVERMLGGSCTYIALSASYFSTVRIVAVVGEDFDQQDHQLLEDRGIDLAGLEKVPGKTFFWAGVYTDDSRVCSAAVHAGLITLARGGTVTIKILPGRPSYLGSTRNGVRSSPWASYTGSYSFVVAPKVTGPILDGGRTWAANAAAFQGTIGGRYRYSCPPNGKLGKVIGAGTYAPTSSVCSAAVHAGQISVTQGGNVVILVRAGRPTYAGTVKNGVTSRAGAATKRNGRSAVATSMTSK